jgi:hypothetical protein
MTMVEGGCQCGAVRYRAELDLDSGVTCNDNVQDLSHI